MSGLELKIPPDVVWIAIAALMWLASRMTPGVIADPLVRFGVATLFSAAGIALIVAARIMLNRAHTTWHPTEPERTSSLVSTGVFGFSRNPTYLGMLIVLAGWGVALASPFAIALSAVFVLYLNRFQIEPEERMLSTVIGDGYREYTRRVRRWL